MQTKDPTQHAAHTNKPTLDPKLRRLFPKKKKPNASNHDQQKLIEFFNAGEFEACQKLAIVLTQQQPENGLLWKVLGAVEQNLSNNDAAIVALQKAQALLPADADVVYNLGNAYFDLAQHEAAINAYQSAININPIHHKAHFNLASVLEAVHDLAGAEAAYCQSIDINPDEIQPYLKLVGLLDGMGRFDEAIEWLKKITTTNQESSEVYLTLAIELGKNQQVEQANIAYEKAIALAPDDINLYNNYGLYLQEQGALQKAEQIFLAGFNHADANAEILCSIGMLYYKVGRLDHAIHCFKQSLVSFPDKPITYVNYALYLYNTGNIYDSVSYGLKALALDPENLVALNNLGLAYQACNQFEESVKQFEKVIELQPDNVSALSNISLPLKRLGRLSEAEKHLEHGLTINPKAHDLLVNMASIYQAKGRIVDAAELNKKAIEIAPERLMPYHNLLFDMCYSDGFSREEIMAELLATYGKMATQVATLQFDQWRKPKLGEKLRVGFVSADFILHPVTSFLTTVLDNFDQDHFELYAYSNNAKEDAVTQQIKPYFLAWELVVGKSDEAVARQIHADGIDILIDLSGHTGGTRLPVFAYKPAPVQVTWLGYWASTGIEQMDYILLDDVSAPAEIANQFTEQVHSLPTSRFCYSPPTEQVEVAPLPALTNGYVTLGCYHNYSKVTDKVLGLWAACLQRQSDLQLRWVTTAFKDDAVVQEVHDKFAQYGVDATRVNLIASLPRIDYLKSFAKIDLMIDAFPFTSCTTASDGLWMGVPTIAMAGDALVSRQSTSLMHAVDLPDWVANNHEEYTEKVIRFANDLTGLAQIRASLRARISASPFGNAGLFTRNLETALRAIWRDHLTQQTTLLPQSKQLIQTVHSDTIAEHIIVSATRSSESTFWAQSALGISLKKLEKLGISFSYHIAFDNTEGLPLIYNRVIEQAPETSVLTFIHDDVWLDDASLFTTLDEALLQFDVVGTAGNKRLVSKQANWLFMSPGQKDAEQYLSGQNASGSQPHGFINFYGPAQQACETLDGVLLTAKASRLKQSNVWFDSQFDFHFYDMDFCRTARCAGLNLGTWVLNITHESPGGYDSGWYQIYKQYLAKWEPEAIPHPFNDVNVAFADSVKEVLSIAQKQLDNGQLDEAEKLYREVLAVMPDQHDALYLLSGILMQRADYAEACSILEKAVMNKPDSVDYRIAYVDALMQQALWGAARQQLNFAKRKGLPEIEYQVRMQRILQAQ